MLSKALLTPPARSFMPAVAAKAMSATTRAYSTMSCPSIRRTNSSNFSKRSRASLFTFGLPPGECKAQYRGNAHIPSNFAAETFFKRISRLGELPAPLRCDECKQLFTRERWQTGCIQLALRRKSAFAPARKTSFRERDTRFSSRATASSPFRSDVQLPPHGHRNQSDPQARRYR